MKKQDFERIRAYPRVRFEEERIYIPYFQNEYCLDTRSGRLKKVQKDGTEVEDIFFNEAMAVNHFLYFSPEYPREQKSWIPAEHLDGIVSRHRRDQDLLSKSFVSFFTGKLSLLKERSKALGGIPGTKGDFSCTFPVLPKIEIQLVFYDADEDFPASVTVFFPDSVTDFIHYETVGCIVSDLFLLLTKEET